MKIEVLNQYAGVNPIGSRLRQLLAEGKDAFHHVKFLMAYVNDSGIGFLKNELEVYHDSGGILEFIVGIEGGITTSTVLKFIKDRLSSSDLYVFHDPGGKCCLHSKVVIFEGEKRVVALIGSANITLGGLYCNCESALLVELKRDEEAGFVHKVEETWTTYRNPQKPLSPQNLISVTPELVKELSRKLRSQRRNLRKAGSIRLPGVPAVKFKVPAVHKLTHSRTSSTGVAAPSGSRCFLEVLKETGSDGTQVQVPTDVLAFFGRDITKPIHLRIRVNGSPVRDAYINHFPNFTHRLSLRELGGIGRPAMLVLARHKQELNTYDCSIRSGNQYTQFAHKLKNRTRKGAKGWSIE